MNQTIKLGQIVKCAEMTTRRCLHFLDKGVIALGPQQDVQRGNHRQFEIGTAFSLILTFRLSELGIPLSRLKQIVAVVHEHFQKLKMGPSDAFCPPVGSLDAGLNWHLVVARGEYLAIVPRDFVLGWFQIRAKWYSLKRKRMIVPPLSVSLELSAVLVPLCPIADCLEGAFSPERDLTSVQVES